ncbi:Transcriptional regulatory protein DegU [compost metagenome]
MAYGRNNAEIAGILNISQGTVKTHIHRILQKLAVEDRTKAVVLAIRTGLVE